MKCSQCEHYIEANAGKGKIYGCDRSKCVFEPTTKNDLGVDYISRKAALDITWHDPSYSDPLNVLAEIRDKIRELPSVTPQVPRWIPVSERLPDKKGEYIVTFDFRKQNSGICVGVVQFHGRVRKFTCYNDSIIAWQPLPKPYEESEGV